MPVLLPVALSFACGIVLQQLGWPLWWLFVPVGLAAVCWLWHRSYYALILAGLVLGTIDASVMAPRPVPDNLYNSPQTYSGRITRVSNGEASQSAIIEVDSVNNLPSRKFKVLVVDMAPDPVLTCDFNITVKGELEPFSYLPDFPGDPDYSRWMRQQGVQGRMVVADSNIISLRQPNGWRLLVFRVHDWVTCNIERSGLSQPAKDFLLTTLAGERQALSPDHRELFSKSGLAHLLAISGLHMGMIAWIISLMLWPLRVVMMHRTRLVLVIILMWCFVLLVGVGAAVVRSAIMASLFLLARLLERETYPLNSLSLAALVILIFSPFSLFEPGFQLTFLAVAAILIITPKLVVVSPRRRWLSRGWEVIAVSFAAMVGTGIFAAFYFHVFPCYFLIANIVAALLLPFLLLTGIIMCVCTGIGIPCGVIQWVCDNLYKCLVGVSSWVSKLPGATLDHIYLPVPVMWLLVLAMILLVAMLYRRNRLYLFSAMGCLALAFLVFQQERSQYPYQESYILYEGKSTGFLVRQGPKVWYFTTQPRVARTGDLGEISQRAEEFLGRRGLGEITLMPDTFTVAGVSRCDNLVSVNGSRYLFLARDDQLRRYGTRIDNAVICAGFKGDVIAVDTLIQPGLMILSRDLNVTRHNRYASELKEAKIPFISLREGYMVSKAPFESSWR